MGLSDDHLFIYLFAPFEEAADIMVRDSIWGIYLGDTGNFNNRAIQLKYQFKNT